jgi:uncharacterized protein
MAEGPLFRTSEVVADTFAARAIRLPHGRRGVVQRRLTVNSTGPLCDDRWVNAIVLETSDGQRLAGDLARPAGEAVGGVVVCHPHPLYGGNRFNPVVDAVFRALPGAGFAAIRFDFRSDHDNGRGERLDVVAALEALSDALGDAVPLFAVGYSFGAMVVLTTVDERITARVAIAPPVTAAVAAPGSPVLALVARHDQYAPPERIIEATAAWPDVEIDVIESADHFLAGHTAAVAERATEWLERQLRSLQ